MGTNSVSKSEMSNFSQGQGQFCRIAELDNRQVAREGEGHGCPESNQGIPRRRTSGTPHKVFRRLTQRLRKRAISEWKLIIEPIDETIIKLK
jgi:hypothetical protein